MNELLALLQNSALATALQQSLWLYPIINTTHIMGIALLFGAIMPLDLRLLGIWSTIPLNTVNRILFPVIVSGFFLSVISGLLLFITQAEDYSSSTIFLSKMVVLISALLNAAVIIFSRTWRQIIATNQWSIRIKVQALISLLLWTTVIFLGRLIGYR